MATPLAGAMVSAGVRACNEDLELERNRMQRGPVVSLLASPGFWFEGGMNRGTRTETLKRQLGEE